MSDLIIDCHAICHQVKYTLGDLSQEDQGVGIIFGFLKQILALNKRFNTRKFIFCWDSKRSFRRDIYPTYKIRDKKPYEEILKDKWFFRQFADLRLYVLPRLGFKNIFIQTGLEADDIIAAITQNYDREFIIVSGDADLYQLLTDKVSMFLSKKKQLYSIDRFEKEYKITPKDWIMVKQVAGCKSDKVAGIVGVGDKRAVSYIRNELGKSTKAYKDIVEGSHIIERNKELVKLPFKGTKVPKLVNDKFNMSGFIDIVDEYDFRSMKNNLNEWYNWFYC